MIHPWFYDLMKSGESYCVAESKYLHGVIHILLRLDHMYTHSEYCGSSSCWKRQRQRCLWVFFLSDSYQWRRDLRDSETADNYVF